MSMKRYLAPNMQAALKQVREDLGADAVILSTQKVEGGVEVICALEEAIRKPAAKPEPSPAAKPATELKRSPDPIPEPSLPMNNAEATMGFSLRKEPYFNERKTATEQATPVASADKAEQQAEIKAMRDELNQLRDLIQARPEPSAPQSPVSAEVTASVQAIPRVSSLPEHPLRQRLDDLGFAPSLSEFCLSGLAADQAEKTWQQVLERLSTQFTVCDREPLADRGVHVFVGAAGAGKTTTIAKLAARFVLQYGAEQIALVTTDRYRIAGARQLQTLGQLLKVDVVLVDHREVLDDVLDRLADKQLILVDTAGLTPSDESWQAQNQVLRCERHRVRRCLVLPASSQAGVLKAQARAWQGEGIDYSILTKVDEAWSLGEAYSVAIALGHALGYVTDGQQVAANIHRATARLLVAKLLEKWKENESWQQSTGDTREFGQDLVI